MITKSKSLILSFITLLCGVLFAQLDDIGTVETDSETNSQSMTVKGQMLTDDYEVNQEDLNGNGIPDILENEINHYQLSGAGRYLATPSILNHSGSSIFNPLRLDSGEGFFPDDILRAPSDGGFDLGNPFIKPLRLTLNASWRVREEIGFDLTETDYSFPSDPFLVQAYDTRFTNLGQREVVDILIIHDLEISLDNEYRRSLARLDSLDVKLFKVGSIVDSYRILEHFCEADSIQIAEELTELDLLSVADGDFVHDLGTREVSLFTPVFGSFADESIIFGGQFTEIRASEYEENQIEVPYEYANLYEEGSDPNGESEYWESSRRFSLEYLCLPETARMRLDMSELYEKYRVRYTYGAHRDAGERFEGDELVDREAGTDTLNTWREALSDEELIIAADPSSIIIFQILAKEGSNENGPTNFTVTTEFLDDDGDYQELETMTIEVIPAPSKFRSLSHNINTEETSGSKYRKVSLTGLPLSDTKPQGDPENDVEKEETYVDALNGDLFHSTTDIYVPVPASDLALTVRRNARSTTWTASSGFKPRENPNAPFGAAWSSNLASHVVFNEQTHDSRLIASMDQDEVDLTGAAQVSPNTVTVFDENGSSYNFIIDYVVEYDLDEELEPDPVTGLLPPRRVTTITRRFVPTPSDKTQLSSYLVSIDDHTIENGSSNVPPLIFKKKHGSVLSFNLAKSVFVTTDRISGSRRNIEHTYFNLDTITDKAGNQLQYTYPANGGLIPSQISVVDRPDLQISITQQGGRVSQIQDPNGNIYTYNYGTIEVDPLMDENSTSEPVLTSVNRGQGVITHYEYDSYVEPDHRVNPEVDILTGHINLSVIDGPYTDDTYTFAYEPDLSRLVYTSVGSNRYHALSGMPRNVSNINLPGNRNTTFTYNHVIRGTQQGTMEVEERTTTVIDAEGHKKRYSWDETKFEETEIPRGSYSYIPKLPTGSPTNNDELYLIGMTEMILQYYEGTDTLIGQEVFSFDPTAGYTPSSVVDFSGNVTTFEYGDMITNHAFNGAYSDPTSQTNALGDTKTYTYGSSRVMTSITDENGNLTQYELNEKDLRTSETISDAQGNILSITKFEYNNQTFPMFMTKRIRRSSGTSLDATDPEWVGDLTTIYTPDANGRIAREVVDLNGDGVDSPGDIVTLHTYDANGNKLNTTDPRGYQIGFDYDMLNRLIKTTFQDGTFKECFYDKRSKKVMEKDENGVATGYFYDHTGRLISSIRDMDRDLSLRLDHEITASSTISTVFTGVDSYSEANRAAYLNGTSYDIITHTGYNDVDSPIKGTDPRGFISVTEYDGIQRPTKTITPRENTNPSVVPTEGTGYVTTLRYEIGRNTGGSIFDVSGFAATSMTDSRGYETILIRDGLYRPIIGLKEYETGKYTRTLTEYDSLGNTTASTAYRNPYTAADSPIGSVQSLTTKTIYDGLNRPTSVIKAFGTGDLSSTASTVYTSTGFAHQSTEQVTDTLSRTSDTVYDLAGRAIQTLSPEVFDALTGQDTRPITTTEYDANSNVISTTNPLGNIWEYRYDSKNRRVQEIQPAVTDALTSSDLGLVSAVENSIKPVMTTEYDAVGNVTGMTDYRGFVSTTVYDDSYRVVGSTTPEVYLYGENEAGSLSTTSSYDANNNIIRVIDFNGNATINTYDALNRLSTTKTNPQVVASDLEHTADITVTNTYDSVANLLTVRDGEDQITAFEYDGSNRKTKTIWDSNDATRRRIEQTIYDAMLPVEQRNPNENGATSMNLTYDARFRVSGGTFPAATGRSADNYICNYDLADRKLSITHPNDPGIRDTTYEYDLLDRTVFETSAGITHQYKYDHAGNTITTIYGGGGKTINCTYDALNRLERMAESGRETSYYYDLGGNILEKHLPNGLVTTCGYDALGRKGNIYNATSAQNISSFHYQYDASGNVREVEERQLAGGIPSRTITNTYDRVYRLAIENIVDPLTTETTVYDYDKANNRTSKQNSKGGVATSTNYIYGNNVNGANSNQLVSYTEQGEPSITFTYDQNGNRVAKHEGNTLLQSYIYDVRNRLLSVNDGELGEFNYDYDARTRRVNRDESIADVDNPAKTTLSFSHGVSALEYDNGNTAPDVEYIRGSDYGGGIGGVLYTLRGNTPSYNSYNSRGDVTAKTNENGSVSWQASYEAFGTRTVEMGENQDRQKANTKDEDPTGLLNEHFRYRDLETGVFITRDPAGFVDGPNVYTYVTQNPWTFFDPFGLEISSETKNRDDGGKHTKIKYTATLIDISDGKRIINKNGNDYGQVKRSKKELENLRDKIKEELEYSFTETEGEHTYEIEVDIMVVESAKDLEKTKERHMIVIEDMNQNNDYSKAISKNKKEPIGGVVNAIGGRTMVLNNYSANNTRALVQTATHEFGHQAGLRHPWAPKSSRGFDEKNPLRNLGNLNVMSYETNGRNIHVKQIVQIQKKYDAKQLNLPKLKFGSETYPDYQCSCNGCCK